MATSPKHPPEFEPVPVRARHDGWTVERQIAFVEKLADLTPVPPRVRTRERTYRVAAFAAFRGLSPRTYVVSALSAFAARPSRAWAPARASHVQLSKLPRAAGVRDGSSSGDRLSDSPVAPVSLRTFGTFASVHSF
jgi:hypothetical protein